VKYYYIYCDSLYIYKFWPHTGKTIAQAWGRLKGLLLKNPSHGLSKGIILINLYVRFCNAIRTLWIIQIEGVSHMMLLMKHGNY
jgi:hypothetical protein